MLNNKENMDKKIQDKAILYSGSDIHIPFINSSERNKIKEEIREAYIAGYNQCLSEHEG